MHGGSGLDYDTCGNRIGFTLNLKIENAQILRYKLTPAAVAYYVKYFIDFG